MQQKYIRSPVPAKLPKVEKKKSFEITPRIISVFFLLTALTLSAVFSVPIIKIFQGEWILKQSIPFIPTIELDFLGNIPIGPIDIRFYSICIMLAALAGFSLSLYLSKRHFLPDTLIDRLFIGVVVVGLIGSRIFYVIFNWQYYQAEPIKILYINEGGLAIFGALTAGLIYILLYCKKYNFNFYEFGDFIAPGLLLGQVIGRFGNIFNYEGFGPQTSVYWKFFVPKVSTGQYGLSKFDYFHPTFLYEIIPNFFLLFLLLFFYDKLTHKRAGIVLGLYCIGYGMIRFVTEFYRIDALKINLPTVIANFLNTDQLLASQLAALILILTGTVIFLRRRKILYLDKTMEEVKQI
jgi:phosphatidylglycerol---prolipoprotein diacylglyceryl transferase